MPASEFSRQEFFRLLGAASLTTFLGTIGVLHYLRQIQQFFEKSRNESQVFWVPEVVCLASHTYTTYTDEAIQRTMAVVVGDSIGKGYYKKGAEAKPAAAFAVDAVNANHQLFLDFGSNWSKHVTAQEGSRIADVDKQLDDMTLNTILEEEANCDMWLSVGGNDIVHQLATRADRLRSLSQNPFQEDFFTLDDDIIQAIKDYQIKFATMLSGKIAKMSIKRLVVEGLPNLGDTDKIEYVSADGKVVAQYILKDNPVAKLFGRNVAVMVNNAMKTAINDLVRDNPTFDIIFLDNFNDLPHQDLLGEHPLPVGQKDMAVRFLNRANSVAGNLGQLLFPHFRHKLPNNFIPTLQLQSLIA